MGRPETGSSNDVMETKVLVVSENVVSWVGMNPLLGAKRVGLFVSEPISSCFPGGWR